MRVALIGRTATIVSIGLECVSRGHDIAAMITARESQETTSARQAIEKFAGEIGCEIFLGPSLDPLVDQIKRLSQIDIALSVNYPSILKSNHIDLFRLGVPAKLTS